MTLDEPKDTDLVYQESSIPFIIEKAITEELARVNIDYRNTWMGKSLVINGKSKLPGMNNACRY